MTTVFADTFYYIALLSQSDAAHNRAKQFTERYAGKMVTTETDCISFAVMKRERINEALTGDHDFQQPGFTALLG